ncbi:MAG: winged helix-turn-helix transcriptional regulator [Chloroflexi bacterium]|nr:winged helix-turn-helix transcriptional regulator [Chloroflexota bacterium]
MLSHPLTLEVSELEANLCYAFVDPTRILILYALNEQPLNVTELTNELGLPQSKTSRHLKVLRDHGLVRTKRHGVSITYELADCRLIEALNLLRAVLHDQLAYKANMVSEMQE